MKNLCYDCLLMPLIPSITVSSFCACEKCVLSFISTLCACTSFGSHCSQFGEAGRTGNRSTFQRCLPRSGSVWALLSGRSPSHLSFPADKAAPAGDGIPVAVLWVGSARRQKNKTEWILPVAGFAGGGVLGGLSWGDGLGGCSGQVPAMPLEGRAGGS